MDKKLKIDDYQIYINYLKQGLRQNISNGSIYCLIAKVYEENELYDKSYLWYKGALQYLNDNRDNIKKKIEEYKQNKDVKVRDLSIIIVTRNNLENLKRCIENILANNKYEEFEIIVVDNNSNDYTKSYLESERNLKFVRNNEKKNFAYCLNEAYKVANKSNDILFLDDDVMILPNSILNMRIALYHDDNIGAVGAVSDNYLDSNKISLTFRTIQDYLYYVFDNNISNEDSYAERVYLESFAMLIRNECLNKVGLFDEKFNCRDNVTEDYSLRIINENYRLIVCNDSIINHNISQSKEDLNSDVTRDKTEFKEKWRIDNLYFCSIRYDLINLFDYDINDNINVLEIGCGCGSSLIHIKSNYKNASVYGIDINKNAVSIASKLIKVYCLDVENDNFPFSKGYFDIIMIPDVIEHLRDPWETLKKIKKYLKADGQILASIPNVMNISVVDSLLSGYWPYTNSGILDKTHLRFFTFDEVVKLFNYIGCKDIQVLVNWIVLSKEQEERIDILSDLYKSDAWKFKAYQYLVSTKSIKTERIRRLIIKKADSEDKMLSFILCINNYDKFEICKYFISQLYIPKGYGVEIITISNAKSITSGYNKIIKECQSKYKIYIHQDVYITNKNIINDLLSIFNDKSIGLIGLAGCKGKPSDGIWWNDNMLVGNVLERRKSKYNNIYFKDKNNELDKYEMFIIDGCFMATQYDLEWDETNFDGWHFYDASQSLNYRNNNMKVIVPNMKESWIIHDCGDVSLKDYDKYRKIFVEKYYK